MPPPIHGDTLGAFTLRHSVERFAPDKVLCPREVYRFCSGEQTQRAARRIFWFPDFSPR